MERIERDEVLRLVKMRGPVIPNELRKALGRGDTTLLGALLSELSSKGLVKVSSTKLGGSPFYYDPAHPESLEKISEHLGEKDQRTYKLLKERKVLRDDAQEALTRVSLRNIKDFSRMLTVNAPEGQVTYWKYYLVSDAEAETLIKKELGMLKEEVQVEKKEPQGAEAQKAPPTPEKPPLPPPEKSPLPEKREEKRAPERKRTETRKEPEQAQQQLLEEIEDEFYDDVKRLFDKNGIAIVEQRLIRKRSEIDLVIRMPTPMGSVEYFCKAKSKKRSTDGDLASAKLQGNARNLPVLYLTTGEITKKAEVMLAKEFKGLVVKRL